MLQRLRAAENHPALDLFVCAKIGMSDLSITNRLLLGGFFITNGINHFRNLNIMAGHAESKATPASALAVGGSGVLLLLGGLSLVFGFRTIAGAALLIIFLLGLSFKIHNYWAVQDPQPNMGDQINFRKNMALLGALLMLTPIPRPWPLSVERSRPEL